MSFREAYREVGRNLERLPAADPRRILAARPYAGSPGNLNLKPAEAALRQRSARLERRSADIERRLAELAGAPISICD